MSKCGKCKKEFNRYTQNTLCPHTPKMEERRQDEMDAGISINSLMMGSIDSSPSIDIDPSPDFGSMDSGSDFSGGGGDFSCGGSSGDW